MLHTHVRGLYPLPYGCHCPMGGIGSPLALPSRFGLLPTPIHLYEHIYVNFISNRLCDVVYAAFALSIAYGALVGIVSRVQALISIVFGVVLFAVNRLVVIHYLYVSDVGGSMTVYMFGGLYGLAILAALLFRDKNWCCICKYDRTNGYTQLINAVIGIYFFTQPLVFWLFTGLDLSPAPSPKGLS